MRRFGLLVVCAVAAVVAPAGAAVVSWTSAGDGAWTNDAHWSGGAAPGPGDDAVFNGAGSGRAVIDTDVAVRELWVEDGYGDAVTFEPGVAAALSVSSNLYLGTDSSIACPHSSTAGTGAGRVLTVGGDATIRGTLTADAMGFPWQTGPGFAGTALWGAAHGGRVGLDVLGGTVYGSVRQPASLGSGSYQDEGGGAIKLVAGGTITVDGLVTANPSQVNPHGAAGGSVWLVCDTLAGGGTVRAEGGTGPWGRAGGGGRIALDYVSKTFNGTVSAAGGTIVSIGWDTRGQPGSLWEPRRYDDAGADVVLDGVAFQYFFPDVVSNRVWSLLATNHADVYFHAHTNGVLAVDGVEVVDGSYLRFDVDSNGLPRQAGLNALVFSNRIAVGSGSVLGTSEGAFSDVPLDVSVDGASTWYTHAATARVTTLFVSGDSLIDIGHGNILAVHPASGGTVGTPHGEGTTWICDVLQLEGRMTMNGGGFPAPSGGPGGAAKTWDGGSHGGLGGGQASAPTAPTYGLVTRPGALGSGSRYAEGDGGGAIELRVSGDATVNGVLSADGAYHAQYGGGSGGSILLTAYTLSGTGAVYAVGGHGNLTGSHGGGGGGRIAADADLSGFGGSWSAAPGASQSSAYPARHGTLFLCDTPWPGAGTGQALGKQLATALGAESHTGGVRIARKVTRWGLEFAWTDESRDLAAGNAFSNTATYTLSGLVPGQRYNVFLDGLPLAGSPTNSGPGGVILFGASLTNGPLEVRVEPPAAGSVVELR